MSALKLAVLVVDDEPPARRKIRRFLEADPDIETIDEAGDGRTALRALQKGRHDLVFLDVQMPALDGFGVIEELDRETLPEIVFVTAHDDYAIKAFQVRALDYLLKPFDEKRFRQSLARAKQHIRMDRTAELAGAVESLVQEIKGGGGGGAPRHLERIMVKSGGRVFFVKTRKISWIEAAANYVKLYVLGDEHLLRDTLEGLEKKLDPGRFARVHRSHIVNIDHVTEMYHWSHGDYMIVLKDGTELKLSRRYRGSLPNRTST